MTDEDDVEYDYITIVMALSVGSYVLRHLSGALLVCVCVWMSMSVCVCGCACVSVYVWVCVSVYVCALSSQHVMLSRCGPLRLMA